MHEQRMSLRRVAAVAGMAALLGAALLPAGASGQAAAGGDQYIPPGDVGPSGGDAAGPGSDELPGGAADETGPSAAGTDAAGDGDLPFTGYPLSLLVLIMLALLLLGAAMRFGPPAYRRMRASVPRAG